MSLRNELIQVAAVAVQIIEDIDEGLQQTTGDWRTTLVMAAVSNERLRQKDKWGDQHHDPVVWLAILAEEVGEAARTIDLTGLTEPQTALVSQLADAEVVARWVLKEATE